MLKNKWDFSRPLINDELLMELLYWSLQNAPLCFQTWFLNWFVWSRLWLTSKHSMGTVWKLGIIHLCISITIIIAWGYMCFDWSVRFFTLTNNLMAAVIKNVDIVCWCFSEYIKRWTLNFLGAYLPVIFFFLICTVIQLFQDLKHQKCYFWQAAK
jgi:hypothetical protein